MLRTDLKLLYISSAVSNIYRRKIVIWGGFGPVVNTEKNEFGRLGATFQDIFFMVEFFFRFFFSL